MKKIWVSEGEAWRRMGQVVVGLGCVAITCVVIHWFQNPELSGMELFLEEWKLIGCGVGLGILGCMMIEEGQG